MKTLVLKIDKRYRIEPTSSSRWFRSYRDNVMIGLCMSLNTAIQVIFRDIQMIDKNIEYLNKEDFKEVDDV